MKQIKKSQAANNFYLVQEAALPDVYSKVMAVKKAMEDREYKSINQAVKAVGLSRSAYYKYRNSVFEYQGTDQGQVTFLTIYFEPLTGLVGDILGLISDQEIEIVSINQGLAVNGIASLNLALILRDKDQEAAGSSWQRALRKLPGVRRILVLTDKDLSNR